MTPMRTIALFLSLMLAACGGGDPAVEVAGSSEATPLTTTAQSPPSTSAPTPAATTTPPADTDPEPTESTAATEPTQAATRTLVLTGEGLPPGDYTVVVQTADGEQVSTQPFDGTTVAVDLGATPADAVSSVSVHAGTSSDGPVLLSGPLTGGSGTLEVALPVDLSSASGQYILATPTNGGDSDERSGVWYVLIPRAPGLVLPVLPAAWVYEGWVTIDGVDVTTGRFSDPATPDDFAGFSGDQGGPPLPGEDFLRDAPAGTTFPVDLAGLTTFVTIEPAEDPSPTPSGLTVLTAAIPADARDHTIYDMTLALDALPTLQAQIS